MRFLPDILAQNRRWASQQKQNDPDFFARLCAIQRPRYLWIGCADSRVPANTIVGLTAGEVFVHRNVANVVRPDDPNCLSVLQYAVDVLGIAHIIVCGHYGCGGVQLALGGPATHDPLQAWLEPVRALSRDNAVTLDALDSQESRWNRLCELNVIQGVRQVARTATVQEAWSRGQPLTIHGWIYDLSDGLLRDLGVSVDGSRP